MPQNNYKSCNARISRKFFILSLVFIFLCGGYAVTEEIQDKAFFASEDADTSIHEVADWIVNSRDNKEKPFVIVDKKQAKIYVFRKEGLIIATSPALIGQAIGDFSFPGVGEKKLCEIKPYERTTPAGKFLARRGRNLDGTEVIWIDFDTALAIHPISSNPEKHQLQRLKSRSSEDKRSTLGCVTVTKEFYITIISPLFAEGNGFVYILPETKPLNDFFKVEITKKGS